MCEHVIPTVRGDTCVAIWQLDCPDNPCNDNTVQYFLSELCQARLFRFCINTLAAPTAGYRAPALRCGGLKREPARTH